MNLGCAINAVQRQFSTNYQQGYPQVLGITLAQLFKIIKRTILTKPDLHKTTILQKNNNIIIGK